MAKRKQPEPSLVCPDSKVEVTEEAALDNGVPVNQETAWGGSPIPNCGAGEVIGTTRVNVPSPAVTGRPLTDEEQATEAF